MRVREALETGLVGAHEIVAGHNGLDRTVSWVHVVELPDPWHWVGEHQLLLTTGFAWSKNEMDQRELIRDLAEQGVAAIGLAVPSYIKHFSEEAVQEANRVDLPLIEIPWEIPFARITEGINRLIIREQEERLRQADVIHRALTNAAIEAESIDEIVTAFSDLIGRSVVLEDHEGNIIAMRTNTSTAEEPAAETLLKPLCELLDATTMARLQKSHEAQQYTYRVGSQSNTLVACPVWLKREFIGVIWIPEGTGSRELLGRQAAEHAATVIALHIARDRAVANVEHRLRLSLVDTLLEGQFSADTIGMERAALMSLDPHGSYKVMIVIMPASLPLDKEAYLRREQIVSRIARRLNQLGVLNLISPSLNEVAVILPEDFDESELLERHIGFTITACVGRPHSALRGIHTSYQEAKSITEWAIPGTVNTYDNVLLPRLFRGDKSAREQFIGKWTTPLRQALHGDVYVETLLSLAASGFRQRKVAEALSIHPKTVQYRVTRIAKILNVDLGDPDVQFQLQLLNYITHSPDQETSLPLAAL